MSKAWLWLLAIKSKHSSRQLVLPSKILMLNLKSKVHLTQFSKIQILIQPIIPPLLKKSISRCLQQDLIKGETLRQRIQVQERILCRPWTCLSLNSLIKTCIILVFKYPCTTPFYIYMREVFSTKHRRQFLRGILSKISRSITVTLSQVLTWTSTLTCCKCSKKSSRERERPIKDCSINSLKTRNAHPARTTSRGLKLRAGSRKRRKKSNCNARDMRRNSKRPNSWYLRYKKTLNSSRKSSMSLNHPLTGRDLDKIIQVVEMYLIEWGQIPLK